MTTCPLSRVSKQTVQGPTVSGLQFIDARTQFLGTRTLANPRRPQTVPRQFKAVVEVAHAPRLSRLSGDIPEHWPIRSCSALGRLLSQTSRVAEPHLFRVILPVSDIEAAASFYAHALGIPGDRVSGGRHYFPCG